MILFIIFTAIILCFILVGYLCWRGKKLTWMSIEYTNIIKGIAILAVIWAHVGAEYGIQGIQFIAGVGVSLFLICSGYGLECSYRKNGLEAFWRKRVLKVFVPYWIVVIISNLFHGTGLSVKDNILDLFCIKLSNGYHWFVQYILICYIIFVIIKMAREKSQYRKPNSKVKTLYSKLCFSYIIFGNIIRCNIF